MNAIKLVLFNYKGTGHKVAHNITTIANIPLVAWMLCTILSLRGADYEAFQAWFAQPINMVFGALFVVVLLTHFALELEVVFEDYIADTGVQHLVVKLMKLFITVLGTVTILSLLKLALV